jgi:cytochrome bd-type quinol oxidase subunit 2
MKAYLVITGAIFGLLAAAHLARTIGKWPPSLASNPWFPVIPAIGVVAAALCVWAIRLLRAASHGG